jgi:hypothetical protein
MLSITAPPCSHTLINRVFPAAWASLQDFKLLQGVDDAVVLHPTFQASLQLALNGAAKYYQPASDDRVCLDAVVTQRSPCCRARRPSINQPGRAAATCPWLLGGQLTHHA